MQKYIKQTHETFKWVSTKKFFNWLYWISATVVGVIFYCRIAGQHDGAENSFLDIIGELGTVWAVVFSIFFSYLYFFYHLPKVRREQKESERQRTIQQNDLFAYIDSKLLRKKST